MCARASFVKQLYCIKQTVQGRLCGRCVSIDSFFLQQLICLFFFVFFMDADKSSQILSVSIHSIRLHKQHNEEIISSLSTSVHVCNALPCWLFVEVQNSI